jgi:hypothetical protein
MKVDPARHAELDLPVFHHGGAARTRSQAVLDPAAPEQRSYFMTAAFTHCILDSQLSCLAKVLLDAQILSLAEVVDAVRAAIRRCRHDFGYVRRNLLSAFYRRNLAHKGLGIPIAQPYRPVDNVLFP